MFPSDDDDPPPHHPVPKLKGTWNGKTFSFSARGRSAVLVVAFGCLLFAAVAVWAMS